MMKADIVTGTIVRSAGKV